MRYQIPARHRYLILLAAAVAVGIPPAATQPSPQWIRVAIVQDDPEVALQIHGGFQMLALASGHPVEQGARLRQTLVRATPEGLALGRKVLPVAGVRIEPSRDATISLNGQRLRGQLEIVRRQDLTLLVVNHVDLEDYLQGVLSKEAPDYWPEAALDAIAIAARTYAVYRRLTQQDGEYDVTGTVMSQDYGGRSAEKLATTRAVRRTSGRILLYHDQLFPAFYHSTCGGKTEHARVMGAFDLAPLTGGLVCEFCSASPFYRWSRRLTAADVSWALTTRGWGSVGAVRDVRVSARTDTGRVREVTITGSRRTRALSGYDFRALFGFERIRSLQFQIIPVEDGFVIRGRGWGHGVGLCQWGAAELARRGDSPEAILAYYYPGSTLANLREFSERPLRVVQGGP